MTEPSDIVRYSIKELLQDIRVSIERLDVKLDGKADKSDLLVIAARVESVEKRLDSHAFRLDEQEKSTRTRKEDRRYRTPLIFSLLMNLASPFLWFGVNHIH